MIHQWAVRPRRAKVGEAMAADHQQTEGVGVDRRAASLHLVVVLQVTCEYGNPAGAMSHDQPTTTTPEVERSEQLRILSNPCHRMSDN